MKKLFLLILLCAAAAIAPASPGGVAGCKIEAGDIGWANIYSDSSTYAQIRCGDQGGCTMAEWEGWYDYMYNVILSSLCDSGGPHQ